MSRIVAKVVHGSHLFGTATEMSDVDHKLVSLPSAEDVLLGRVDRSTVDGTREDPRARNTAEDLDVEDHDLLRYVRLLASGQPVALEMLFAPERFHIAEPHPVWRTLQENADRVVSKEAGKFLGYCRRQAYTYSLKGDRMASATAAHDALKVLAASRPRAERLGVHLEFLLASFADDPNVTEEPRTMGSGRVIRHLAVCGRLVAETTALKEASEQIGAMVREYGSRSRRAMESGGNDWKALSHAVRIGHEAIELLSTGRLTLPSPEAPRLLEIKKGLVERERVSNEINDLLVEVESLSRSSDLPERADVPFLEGIVAEAHADVVLSGRADPLPSPV